MRYLRPILPFLTTPVGLGALALFALGTFSAAASAQKTDPVEDLKLNLTSSFGTEDKPLALKERETKLFEAAKALHTAGDLRRALSLSEWKDNDPINPKISAVDKKVRGEIARQFEELVKNVVDRGDATTRAALAVLLGDMGTNVRALKEKDTSGYVRSLAPSLMALMKNADGRVRQEAARALGKVNPEPKEAVAALKALLETGDPGDRQAAAEALASMVRTVAQLQRKGRAQTDVEASKNDVIGVAALVVPLVKTTLQDADAATRRAGLDALVQATAALNDLILDPETTLPLPSRPVDTWSDFDKRKVKEAREVLKAEQKLFEPLLVALKDQGAALAAALADPDVQVRVLSRRSLEQIGTARLRLMRREASIPSPDGAKDAGAASDPLRDALKPGLLVIAQRTTDPSLQVRRATVDFLESMDKAGTDGVPALVVALGDSDRFVRWAAARTLGKIGPVQTELTVPALARLLAPSEDADVRDVAANTLRSFGTDAKQALPALITVIAAGDSQAREGAIKAVTSVSPEAVEAVPALAAALRSTTASVRRAAADALGQLGALATDAVPDLRLLLDDDDVGVRLAVSGALLNIARPK